MTWVTWFLLGMLAGLVAARLRQRSPGMGKVHHRRLGHHPKVLEGRNWRSDATVRLP